jgi:hypothetical protein
MSLTYTSERLLYVCISLLQHIDDASTRTCHFRDEIRSRPRSSSILYHFPDIGRSNVERIPWKQRPIFLIYASERLLYVCILLLQYIDDASTRTCHFRDEIRSRSSSILDHFPNVGRCDTC